MNFKLRATDSDAQDQQNPIHHSSTFSIFTKQAIPAGYPNEHSDKLRRRFEMTEAIRRELEKERIREEIIAEEVARRRVLEAEVRNELMIERQMAMRTGAPFSHTNLFEPKTLHRQPIGQEEKLDGKYGRGCCNLREIRGFSVSPFQVLADSPKIKGIPEDNKKQVIVLPNGENVSGTKRKLAPPVSEGSSKRGSDRLKRKVKEEWSCAICQVSTTSERGLTEHVKGKKHRAKEAALVAQKTGANFGLGVATMKPVINLSSSLENKSETVKEVVDQTLETNKTSSISDPNEMNGENKKDRFKFWCEMCEVRAYSETVMNAHKEGKKHLTSLVKLCRKRKVDSEVSATANTCDGKPETKTNQEVIVELVAYEVKLVKDDMEYVAAEVKPVKDDMGDVSVEVKPVKDDMEDVSAEVKPVKDDMEDVGSEVKPVKVDMEDVASEVQPVKDDMEDVASEVKPVKDDMEDVASELKPVKDDIEDVASELKPVKDDMEDFASEVKPVKDDMKNVSAQVKPVKDDMEYVVFEVKPVKDDMEYVVSEVKPIKDDMKIVASEVILVKDDMEYVAAMVSEENNTMALAAGFGVCSENLS
ncbi:hypothetical protein L1987_29823 [Smallanthus sonchifolius]|uniref:Uncharacterized protein n=1 Tax=Smallanthus sonchifolius TaxID=185202 RepID=A0ACB9I2W2_9ASTR|nr:hypothetical protein L1987_29823 [Smallanthus sonchifolius]